MGRAERQQSGRTGRLVAEEYRRSTHYGILLTRRFNEVSELKTIFDSAVEWALRSEKENGKDLKSTELKEKINRKVRDIIFDSRTQADANVTAAADRVREAFRTLGFEHKKTVGWVMTKNVKFSQEPDKAD